jgi:hypothetical protein
MEHHQGGLVMSPRVGWFAFLFAACVSLNAASVVSPPEIPARATRLAIVTGSPNSGPELKAAEMLKARILKRSAVTVEMAQEDAPNLQELTAKSDVIFVIGVPGGPKFASHMMHDFGVALPTLPNSEKIHPESFAIHTEIVGGPKRFIVITGADDRGMIYGVGHVLRAMTYLPDALLIPDVNTQDKPAFPIRGGRPSGPGSRARQFGNLRPQTQEEMTEVMEDLMLLGCNVFEGDPASIRAYGMLTTFGRTANEMTPGFPAEWRADGGRSSRYVCPSVPEARKALLESFDQIFRDAPDYDFFTTNSGDEGGCRCEKCMPWGDKYIALVHDIADILHKYHPNCKVLATNQDLTNEGNQAIFDYLNKGDSSWLYAIRYGPGADEMQTYIRGPVNPRWFEYEGFGPLGNYLKFMHHELPRTTDIVLYTDITHWMQAQFAVPHPDVALAAVYDRRSWNTRPRNFHRVGQEILHYALGDMHYSEGMHDDFNKWFWYRMLWNPRQDAESITKEYCRYWFGPDAQDEMADAIFLMEETLEKPVIDNPGITKAVVLLHSAGAKIPENLLKTDYRWRIILEKALMDRYIQLELQHGRALKGEAGQLLSGVETSQQPGAVLESALKGLDQPIETSEMKAVIDEANKMGEEANTNIGYREPAPFIVGKLDLTEVGWWTKVLRQALAEGNEAKIRNAAKMVLHYDDPGPGGFYDDVGWPNESKHLVSGETLWAFDPFSGPAKLSYYNHALSMGKDPPVAFEYTGLDPAAQYVVRISVGARIDEERPALKGMKLSEGLKADDTVISEGFPVPTDDVTFQEFDIPQELTKDGKLKVTLTPSPGPMPITGCAEIWFMQKDKMPWTARP